LGILNKFSSYRAVCGFLNCGFINDNGDNLVSSLPQTDPKIGDDGFFSSSVKILPEEYKPEYGLPQVEEFKLNQNYPNPFNPETTINYSLPIQCRVTINIYNIVGQKIITLQNSEQAPGGYTKIWDASNFPSGIYFAELHVSPIWDFNANPNPNMPDLLIQRKVIKMQLLK